MIMIVIIQSQSVYYVDAPLAEPRDPRLHRSAPLTGAAVRIYCHDDANQSPSRTVLTHSRIGRTASGANLSSWERITSRALGQANRLAGLPNGSIV